MVGSCLNLGDFPESRHIFIFRLFGLAGYRWIHCVDFIFSRRRPSLLFGCPQTCWLTTHMDILDIPELPEIPDPAPYDENPVAVADYLMTALFRRQPAMLHAEFLDGDGRWFVQPAQGDECVAESRSAGEFRSVLARFGAHFMEGQVYGGHTRRILTQCGRKFSCRFFMSNDNSTGYWIRIYTHATS